MRAQGVVRQAPVPGSAVFTTTVEELSARLAALETAHAATVAERDEYKRQYVVLLEAYRKLEAGLVGQKRERFVEDVPFQQARAHERQPIPALRVGAHPQQPGHLPVAGPQTV